VIRKFVLGFVALTALCGIANAQGYPQPVRQVRLRSGDVVRAISVRDGRQIQISCEGGGYPQPMPPPAPYPPPRAPKYCEVKYNAPGACGLYTIFVEGSPITGCIGSIEDVTSKVRELAASGICDVNQIAPSCDLKYNAPGACGLYTVFAGASPITGCIGSTQDATATIQKLRAAGACY